jgi:hypothetical protein
MEMRFELQVKIRKQVIDTHPETRDGLTTQPSCCNLSLFGSQSPLANCSTAGSSKPQKFGFRADARKPS